MGKNNGRSQVVFEVIELANQYKKEEMAQTLLSEELTYHLAQVSSFL